MVCHCDGWMGTRLDFSCFICQSTAYALHRIDGVSCRTYTCVRPMARTLQNVALAFAVLATPPKTLSGQLAK